MFVMMFQYVGGNFIIRLNVLTFLVDSWKTLMALSKIIYAKQTIGHLIRATASGKNWL